MASNDQKPKARLPRGLIDRSAADIRATERMMARIRRVYERYGFEPVETPLIEYTEALGKFLPDQDRPNEGVFSFLDDDEQWLSLRYDLTAPLARYVAENYERLPKPYRSYRSGWVFRNEKPGPGRFRQFMQFDADTVGAASVAADAEMCMMAADTLEELGIPRGAVRRPRQQPQGARRRHGGDRRCRRAPEARRAACHRQARPPRHRGRARALGTRTARRERRLHQGRRTRPAPGGDRADIARSRGTGAPASGPDHDRPGGFRRTRQDCRPGRRRRLRHRPHPHRRVGGARAGILHRAGLRGRAPVRDRQRKGRTRPLRLGRRRRTL